MIEKLQFKPTNYPYTQRKQKNPTFQGNFILMNNVGGAHPEHIAPTTYEQDEKILNVIYKALTNQDGYSVERGFGLCVKVPTDSTIGLDYSETLLPKKTKGYFWLNAFEDTLDISLDRGKCTAETGLFPKLLLSESTIDKRLKGLYKRCLDLAKNVSEEDATKLVGKTNDRNAALKILNMVFKKP